MVWNFQDSYTELPSIFYSKVNLENFSNKKLVLFNKFIDAEIYPKQDKINEPIIKVKIKL